MKWGMCMWECYSDRMTDRPVYDNKIAICNKSAVCRLSCIFYVISKKHILSYVKIQKANLSRLIFQKSNLTYNISRHTFGFPLL